MSRKRFEEAVRNAEEKGIHIDDYAVDEFAIHISWGDWKHEHLFADH